MPFNEKCSGCGKPLIWATIDSKSVLICPRPSCVRQAS